MLHNSGPYGPSDTPINMGTPINLPQMATPLNLGQNLSNFSKTAQETPPIPNGQYNIPNYPPYSHPTLNLSPHMSNFSNYNPMVLPNSYMSHNNSNINDLSWHRNAMPMNLNTQVNHSSAMHNFHANFEKRDHNLLLNRELQDDALKDRRMHINVPQMPFRPYRGNDSDDNYSMFNLNQDKFNNFHQNIDFSPNTQDRPLLDSSKRKSLENTVRLIENILINTTKNKESQQIPTIHETTVESKEITTPKDLAIDASNTELDTEKPNLEIETQDDSNDSGSISSEKSTYSDIDNEKQNDVNVTEKSIDNKIDIETEKNIPEKVTVDKPLASDTETELITIKIEPEDKPCPVNDDSDTDTCMRSVWVEGQPTQESMSRVSNVDVKMEPIYWTDTDYDTPFHRDLNGVPREDLRDETIIDCTTSVNEAIAVFKSGLNPKCHYECPHCGLLFQNTKRFLIHTKWHVFGLTNEKRLELAKEREVKRFQRKEAKIVDKMKADEVTEPTGEKTYPCKICDRLFSSKGSLKNHKSRSHPWRMRACSICGETVAGWSALRDHLAKHSATNYKCTECDKEFKYPHTLAKHRQTHLEKTVSCPQCPKMYGTEAQLRAHMKVHERAQRGAIYKCTHPGCEKAFYEVYNLNVHQKCHEDDRRFPCTICSTNFLSNSSLKRHMRVSHSTSKPFECATCHRCFISETILVRHTNRSHGDPSNLKFACTLCDCRYLRRRNLQKHVSKMHPEEKTKAAQSDSE